MSTPAIIYIVLMAVGLVISLIKDGQPERTSFGSTIFAAIITVGILYWGGFFSPVTDATPECPAVQIVVPDGYHIENQ